MTKSPIGDPAAPVTEEFTVAGALRNDLVWMQEAIDRDEAHIASLEDDIAIVRFRIGRQQRKMTLIREALGILT